jgi:hypothetical protein
MARSLEVISLRMLVILAFGCFSVIYSVPIEEGQLQNESVSHLKNYLSFKSNRNIVSIRYAD